MTDAPAERLRDVAEEMDDIADDIVEMNEWDGAGMATENIRRMAQICRQLSIVVEGENRSTDDFRIDDTLE